MFPVDAGRELARRLTEELELKAAFWLYFDEADEWRLVLVTPLVDKRGTRHIYARIQSFLADSPELAGFPLFQVTVISPRDGTAKPIIEAYDGVDLGPGRYLKRSVVTGDTVSVYLEEAYIYFAKK